jgi:multisubunit Na+/H+ antiporter MnhC subunit
METQSTEKQTAEPQRTTPLRGSLILTILLSLNAFVLGGCVSLLFVNRLLNGQFDVYAATQSMAAASTILDFMDDLLPLYFTYAWVLLVLVLVTASVWVWMRTKSQWLRYGVVLLCLVVLAVLVGIGLSRGTTVPVVPPTTPTPVGSVIDAIEAGL